MIESPDPSGILQAHADHARRFHQNRFVYPVLSRRSRGLSLGVNLNPDKVCNFDCVYCQVDRRSVAETRFVETAELLEELEATFDLIASGTLYDDPKFSEVPESLRRLNDIAFSGDGEPTTYRNFDAIVADVASVKRRRGLDAVKLVLITNASMFHRPSTQRALATLDANQGEVWAKLDAGTEPYYRQIERTTIPFRRILENLGSAAKVRPLVIQSLFLRFNGQGPPADEIAAYCERLNEILLGGGTLDRVQVYTVARRPAEDSVGALSRAEIDAISAEVMARVPVAVETFYGAEM